MSGTEWREGMPCRVVEHVDSTRKPRQGGQVLSAIVLQANESYVRARVEMPGGPNRDASFWSESGWTAWDGSFRWRLLPVTGDETGTPAGEDNS